ncbi:hypothetical protein MHI18_21035 [Peribacillus sp. FSL H8-0477]|uniref:hypothetical protein n=1 Tax=Peribacillus sp. FSL H8-0477 TaxID=2921388 RepID=UPI0030F67AEE
MKFRKTVDWRVRREDSCGKSGTGETPQERKRRGGSTARPRKAKRLERKSTTKDITRDSVSILSKEIASFIHPIIATKKRASIRKSF